MKKLYLAMIFVGLLGCGKQTSEPSNTSTILAGNSKWGKRVLTICWELMSEETKSYRDSIERTTKEAFKDLVISFDFIGQCDWHGDIRIFIYDDHTMYDDPRYKKLKSIVHSDFARSGPLNNNIEVIGAGHPHTVTAGSYMENRQAGLVLNRSFKNSFPGFDELYNDYTPKGQFNLSVSVALHEFGHALGYDHEDKHPDRQCQEFAEPLGRDNIVGPYNPFSFMSRCYYRNYNHNLGILRPNENDIKHFNSAHKFLLEL